MDNAELFKESMSANSDILFKSGLNKHVNKQFENTIVLLFHFIGSFLFQTIQIFSDYMTFRKSAEIFSVLLKIPTANTIKIISWEKIYSK